jgi:hypothetical protein
MPRARFAAIISLSLTATWLASACIVAPLDSTKTGLPDGAECERKEDCRSHACNHNRLCAHSYCECPGKTCTDGGEASPDCSDGWLCVYYESILHGVGEFFGSDGDPNGGTCRPTCAATCPAHYICGGTFCEPDPDWANPVPSVSWSGDAEGTLSGAGQTTTVKLENGKMVRLSASAESPVDVAIKTYAWTVVGDSGEPQMLEGMGADVVLDSGSYRRAELRVSDADLRSSLVTVTFQVCLGTGAKCGYQGSGCCNECDAAKQFCL